MKRKRKSLLLFAALLSIGFIVYQIWNMSQAQADKDGDRSNVDSQFFLTEGSEEQEKTEKGVSMKLYMNCTQGRD